MNIDSYNSVECVISFLLEIQSVKADDFQHIGYGETGEHT